ncbi:hypothetical protein VB713_18710 [Anabaena cylindrica UHCC 0172]|uniref:WD40 repeat domain-containing protein n=1 Tax=Anabaena cylindrica TaxID=1165 RepID=UPI002B1E97DB|nr:hypothetical protein [Anabaena cylindrica]MEA5552980.1 hypothetical protein [Anabaena cylindrica UHCC 0172]
MAIISDYRIKESVAFSQDGQILAGVIGNDIKLWEITTGKEIRTISGEFRVNSVAFSVDGEILCSGVGTSHKTIEIWQEVNMIDKFSNGIMQLFQIFKTKKQKSSIEKVYMVITILIKCTKTLLNHVYFETNSFFLIGFCS